MYEEMAGHTLNLAVTLTKLSSETLFEAMRLLLQFLGRPAEIEDLGLEPVPHGRQSLRSLVRQGEGVTRVPVSETELGRVKRVLDQYGIDYAVLRSGANPPVYGLFFKAKDTATMETALQDCMKSLARVPKGPTLAEELREMAREDRGRIREKVPEMPDRA